MTPPYWAPEMMNEAATFNAFSCDCWALGLVFL